nr:unnamed protein product [Naegleria fowleri]
MTTTDSTPPSSTTNSRFQKNIDLLTKQVMELETLESKVKQLFPQQAISNQAALSSPSSSDKDLLIKLGNPSAEFFSAVGSLIGGASSSYLLYNPVNQLGRRWIKPITSNYRCRYFFTIPILAIINVCSAGIFGGVYPYVMNRLFKYMNEHLNTKIPVNDNFDDFVILGLPISKTQYYEYLKKEKK